MGYFDKYIVEAEYNPCVGCGGEDCVCCEFYADKLATELN